MQVTHLSASQGALNYSLTNRSGNWGYTNLSMPDGVYFAEFMINDTHGNMNTTSVTFTVDTALPLITIDSPQNVSYSYTSIPLNVSADEIIDSWWYSFAGVNTSFTPNTTLVASGGDGFKSIKVWANDTAGNENFSEVGFTIDTVIPEVLNPQVNDTDMNVNIDQVININVTVNELSIKNVTVFNITALVMNNESGVWKINTTAQSLGCSALLMDCTLTFNASDWAGNENTSVQLVLSFDTAAPEVTIISPQAGNTSNITVNFNATVLEKNPGSGVVQVTPDGQGATNYTLTNRSGVWGYTNLSMPDNHYTAQFMIEDALGNMNNEESVIFTIDTTNPSVLNASVNDTIVSSLQLIQINVSVQELNRNDSTVWVSGNAGATNVSMSHLIGDVFQAVSSPSSLGCTESSEISCTLTFFAWDAADNLNGTTATTITVDDVAPNVSIHINNTRPLQGLQSVKIDWNATDTNLDVSKANITYPNGTLLAESTNPDSDFVLEPENLTEQGVYTVTAYAKDLAENENTTTSVFVIGNTVPEVTTPVIIPSTAYATNSLNCSTMPTDPEQAQLNVSFVWYVNDIRATSFDSNVSAVSDATAWTSILVTNLVKEQVWICSVQVSDGFNTSSFINSTAVTIQNSLPVVEQPKTFDSLMQETQKFDSGDLVVIKTNATDGDGTADISSATISISDPNGVSKVSTISMTKLVALPTGFTYGYNYTITDDLSGSWGLTITATDISGAATTVSSSFVVGIPVPKVHSIQINLTLNSTDSLIYIPGVGEQQSGTLISPSQIAPKFFIASYLNENLKGLVFSQEKLISIDASSSSTHHFISMEQNLSQSQAFLVFTKGDYKTIENRMPLIEAGTFLSHDPPSFIIGKPGPSKVTAHLAYPVLDIESNVIIRDTGATVIVENLGTVGGLEVINIEAI